MKNFVTAAVAVNAHEFVIFFQFISNHARNIPNCHHKENGQN